MEREYGISWVIDDLLLRISSWNRSFSLRLAVLVAFWSIIECGLNFAMACVLGLNMVMSLSSGGESELSLGPNITMENSTTKLTLRGVGDGRPHANLDFDILYSSLYIYDRDLGNTST